MRWRPVTPLAFPHALSKDDWVNDYFLPKGATVSLNFEGRHKLAFDYAASSEYMQRDHYVYGAGRRLCPGIHLSERSMFLGAARLLWAFNFEPAQDEKGNPIPMDTDPTTGYTEGFLVCPQLHKRIVAPRLATHTDTVLREFARAESDVLSQYATP
ncbi:cytochrome P450 [Aspergillus piperis CBS 112811]|uniref:Cytochrome P450 n=1 Tax=Aspergillus piperis CBS 112811 TaxID=1448313 RepID=A0A8G1R0Z3_9EURO|nr:cytochrome P450 [Aspergillus piperis CBS 112811]RAH56641.1 cytochrome P450 [Aspergillus piperis CBS 112811]